jgi:hypothetical protein
VNTVYEIAVNTHSISHYALRLSPTISEYPYQHFQDVIYREAAESKHDYVNFSSIDEQTFIQDFDKPHSHLYTDFFPQFQVLLAKMPLRAHKQAYHGMNKILIDKLKAMNVGNNLQLLGTADVKTPERTKRPDLSYLPEQLPAGRPDHWPSVVGECAYSESQSKLASDARWWLNASSGEVKTVLAITMWKKNKGMTLETWGLISRPTRAEPAKKVPEVVQKVVVSQGANDSPVHITGAPLVTGFEELFLRPAEEEGGGGYHNR